MVQILIVTAETPGRLESVRELWRDYWQALGLDPSFQDFEAELKGLPSRYSPPSGFLLLAEIDGQAAGTIALRALNTGADACEAKRLYVRPEFRRHGLGLLLLKEAIDRARAAGYHKLYGDSLPSMTAAHGLYERLGFRRTGPYSADPTPGAIYLELLLEY